MARIQTIGEVLKGLTKDLGIDTKLQEYEAVLRWAAIVGPTIAGVTTATRIQQGTLFVKVSNSVWRNELLMRKKEILQKIHAETGNTTVQDIKFQ